MWNFSVVLSDGSQTSFGLGIETLHEAKTAALAAMRRYNGDKTATAMVWEDSPTTRFEWRKVKGEKKWHYYATPLSFYTPPASEPEIETEPEPEPEPLIRATHCYTICVAMTSKVYSKITAYTFEEAFSKYKAESEHSWYHEEWVSDKPLTIQNDDTGEVRDLIGGPEWK